MFDTAGSRLNFPVVAGVEETFRVSFWVGESGVNVLGATFQAACYMAHGESRGELVAVLPVEHDSAENKVLLTVPELEHGHYDWELRATDPEGKESRLLYGMLSVLNAADMEYVVKLAEESELRELTVQIADGHARPLILRWQSCAAAGSMVVDAARHAAEAKSAADIAERAAASALDSKTVALDELAAARAFMASFNEALRNSIQIVNNYLYIGGQATGHYLKGEPGVTPHIGLDGFWYEGNTKLSDRPAFGADGITPHITPDGFWAFGDYKSNTRAEGRDGLNGLAVRRIPVERYEDIPQSGETCNGGFLYYVPAGVERTVRQVVSVSAAESPSNYTLTGPMVFSDARAWTRRGGRLMRFGLMAGSNTHGGEPSAEQLYAHLYYESAGEWVYAGRSTGTTPQVVNEVSWWDFTELEVVPNGCRVKLVLSQVAAEPTADQVETVRIQVAAVAATEGSNVGGAAYCAWAYWQYETDQMTNWDTYAWLESKGWVRVDINYDIATSEVYGLNKLGTDSVVRDGAPVGVNAAGQMAVPIADPALAGAVLPSSVNNESRGGRTHVGEDKKLYVDFSTPSTPGVGKTSYTVEVENTATVGMTADDKYAVPPAAAFQWGAVKVGSSVPQSMGMPWIIPVGAAAADVTNEYGQNIRGQLMNNVLVNGALRTGTKEMWISWAPSGVNITILPDGSNAVGLMAHPMQFKQSATYGLELLVATTGTLGGVTICETIGSGSGLVPTVGAFLEYLGLNYYTKLQVYTKEETYSKSQVDTIDKKNRQDAAGTYKTAAAAKSDHDALSSRIDGCVKKTESWNGEVYLTLSEYQALKVRDPKIAYNILED